MSQVCYKQSVKMSILVRECSFALFTENRKHVNSGKNVALEDVIASDMKNGADWKRVPHCCLTPHGVSGLKFFKEISVRRGKKSRPVWGEWIEMYSCF